MSIVIQLQVQKEIRHIARASHSTTCSGRAGGDRLRRRQAEAVSGAASDPKPR
jgi:hypothetical protein